MCMLADREGTVHDLASSLRTIKLAFWSDGLQTHQAGAITLAVAAFAIWLSDSVPRQICLMWKAARWRSKHPATPAAA